MTRGSLSGWNPGAATAHREARLTSGQPRARFARFAWPRGVFWSMIAALAPAALAARYARRPAVPAPIAATSTCMVFMLHPRFTGRRRRDYVCFRSCQGAASGRFARVEIPFQGNRCGGKYAGKRRNHWVKNSLRRTEPCSGVTPGVSRCSFSAASTTCGSVGC